MQKCCWYFTLEVGAALSAILFLIISIAEIFLARQLELIEAERALVLLHAAVFIAGALMLIIGVSVGDMVCVYMFIFFGCGAILAKIAANVVFFINDKRNTTQKIGIATYSMILLLIHLYVLVIALSFGKKLWRSHHINIQTSVQLHRWSHQSQHPIMGV